MKKTLLRSATLLLAVVLLLSSFSSCAKKGKTLLTLNKDGTQVTFSVNLYELMLSRMKATLAYYQYEVNGYTPTDDSFWTLIDEFDGKRQTLDAYYCDAILENCKTYLATLYFFEKNGLTLSDERRATVEETMAELLKTDGDGSKTKLNAVLALYGVNYDLLKEAYEMEQKSLALQEYLYGTDASKIGDNLKDSFMKENYVHFKQVFLANYNYVYQTDKNGDVIYYYTEGDSKNHIAYDKNGIASNEKDANGDTVYYNRSLLDSTQSDGTVAYDTAAGSPCFVTDEGTGAYQTEAMSAEELAALETRANGLYATLLQGNETAFEAAIANESDEAEEDIKSYTDGYYIKRLDYEASGADYAYLSEIIETLDGMKVGDVAMVQSSIGYHIIRKYEFSDKAYSLTANATWFSTFADDLTESLFLELCQSVKDDITVNESVLESAKTMRTVTPNYYY